MRRKIFIEKCEASSTGRLLKVFTFFSLLMLLTAAGCQETRGLQRGGPAPTPAAHAHYLYRYYPDSAVYMDTGRKLFFYYNGEKWMTTTLLPAEVRVDWKSYVVLDMDTDKPYRHHAEVVRKHPPRQPKKQEGTKTEEY